MPGLERADSVTVDPHKWFFQAYDIGGLVVRRREDLLTTFHRSPEYYASNRPEDAPLNWYQYSLEGTRRFRALKLWMSWKHLGTDGFGRPRSSATTTSPPISRAAARTSPASRRCRPSPS